MWQRAVRVALSILLFVLCILLVSIVVVTVPFVCWSVKLPLSQHTSFLLVSFHSLPHPSVGSCDRAAAWPFVASHGQIITLNLAPKHGVGIRAGLSRVR